jgi:hypothetical protein
MQSLIFRSAALLLGASLGYPCVAQQPTAPTPAPAMPPPPVPAPLAVAELAPAPVAADTLGFGPALTTAQLAQWRGGSDIPWNEMKLNATVANNHAQSIVTGANTITEGAFANASGLPMVIQNSGANVLIQNATIINVQVK